VRSALHSPVGLGLVLVVLCAADSLDVCPPVFIWIIQRERLVVQERLVQERLVQLPGEDTHGGPE
jgi:hypothetical protein